MKFTLTFSLLLLAKITFSQNDYFFPKGSQFDPAIPTPEQFLGYPIGEWHTRHDRLVAYFEKLAVLSDKAQFQIIGYTNERNPQVVLTVSAPANLARLEDIRHEHLLLAQPKAKMPDIIGMPAIVQLGYGVHGNEASSGEAAMLTAYYFVASQNAEVADYLKNAVLLIDPVYNPDGRDRHTHWVNANKGNPPVAGPLDREHNEAWPGGRTNHYWFDLNRDWLPLSQVESRNRVAFYHKWLPNVATDYHEMGTNATYFFEPTKPVGSENPIVPRRNYEELNSLFAGYFEKAMNDIGSLYYSGESFDNSYPGYGSTYPDIQGGLGLLFEQASSRGHVQHTTTEDLTFAFTIRNQTRTSIATVQAAVENRQRLNEYQRWFFQTAVEEATKAKTKGWLFGDPGNPSRTRAFLSLLRQHQIRTYHLGSKYSRYGKSYPPEDYFVVPANQPQYRMALTFFEPRTNEDIPDSVFYDASAWCMALAFDMPYLRLETADVMGAAISDADVIPQKQKVPDAAYAYLIDWSDDAAPKALHFLLQNDIHVKTAFKPFSIRQNDGEKEFGYGSLLIAVADQKVNEAELHDFMQKAADLAGVEVLAVSTGHSLSGIDLGSRNFRTVEKPKAVMVIGEGTSGYETGEIWHLLDSRVGMSITKVDVTDINRLNLYDYNTLILASGQYDFDDKKMASLKDWIAAGNTLITSRMATKWAIEKKLVKEQLRQAPAKDSLAVQRYDFADARNILGSKRIGGVVFPAVVDITHPLGFGYLRRNISVYRNHDIFVEPPANPFSTVVRYTDAPQTDGYVHPGNLSLVKNTASLLVSAVGRGRVILFVDNPNFRAFWYGTNRLFLNALFFGSLVSVPG